MRLLSRLPPRSQNLNGKQREDGLLHLPDIVRYQCHTNSLHAICRVFCTFFKHRNGEGVELRCNFIQHTLFFGMKLQRSSTPSPFLCLKKVQKTRQMAWSEFVWHWYRTMSGRCSKPSSRCFPFRF